MRTVYALDACPTYCRRRKLEEVAKHEELPTHPNCVGFVKAWEEKQHLYIQTELCRTRYALVSSTAVIILRVALTTHLNVVMLKIAHIPGISTFPETMYVLKTNVLKQGLQYYIS